MDAQHVFPANIGDRTDRNVLSRLAGAWLPTANAAMAKRQTAARHMGFLAWLLGCAGLSVMPAAAAQTTPVVTKNYLPVAVICRSDPDDQILGYICRRIEADAPRLALEYGMRLSVERGAVAEDRWTAPRDTVPLEVVLTATRPTSQFATKEITTALSAPPIELGDPPWSATFVASGVPRDLVHPVADAALERISAFLNERALRERDTSTRIAPQR